MSIAKIGVSLLFMSSFSLNVKPVEAQSSCQATVNTVVREIKRKGVRSVRFEVVESESRDNYFSNIPNPQGFNTLKIIMGALGENSQRIDDILSSEILIKSWVVKISKQCKSTGYIVFGNMTDWTEQYAVDENGNISVLRYKDSIDDIINPVSQIWRCYGDGYCAYVRI